MLGFYNYIYKFLTTIPMKKIAETIWVIKTQNNTNALKPNQILTSIDTNKLRIRMDFLKAHYQKGIDSRNVDTYMCTHV